MTPLVVVVGFLGSGKTTFLKTLLPRLRESGLKTRVIINDYQNARVDAEQLSPLSGEIRAITGDCVCCGSREELLAELEKFDHAPGRVALVETNGTTDSEQLIEMLALEPDLRQFSLPIQVSLIDAQRWQKRFWHNALEREQARTASHIVISRRDTVTPKRLGEVEESLAEQRVRGRQVTPEEFAAELVALAGELAAEPERDFDGHGCCSCGHHHDHDHEHGHEGHGDHHDHEHHHHHHDDEEEHHHHHSAHHFSSLELGLPEQVSRPAFDRFLRELPETVIRAKGLVRFADKPEEYFIFQKVDRFDEPQFFPMGQSPTLRTPLALFIGPELPEAELRQAAGALQQG